MGEMDKMKTRYQFLIIVLIVSFSAYVGIVEIDNYFNGSLKQHSISSVPTSKWTVSHENTNDRNEEALRAKITISPELRSQLEEAQSALDDSGLPLTLYGVDPMRELLMVQILDSAKNTGVEERVLEIVGEDIPIAFHYGPGVVFNGWDQVFSDNNLSLP